jgi:hypothetical protein
MKRIIDLRRELKKNFFSLTIYQTDDRQIDYYERIGLIRR